MSDRSDLATGDSSGAAEETAGAKADAPAADRADVLFAGDVCGTGVEGSDSGASGIAYAEGSDDTLPTSLIEFRDDAEDRARGGSMPVVPLDRRRPPS